MEKLLENTLERLGKPTMISNNGLLDGEVLKDILPKLKKI